MLSIRVEFPSGRYVAAEGHNPAEPEWPPHPSRLYSALVAAAYRSSGGMNEIKRQALEWLESQPAPAIFAPDADIRPAPVSYVPPGDAVERKGKKGEEKYEHPVHRWRQPRYFPEARILGEPFVQFFWATSPETAIEEALQLIAGGVTHLGTSHSLALVTVLDLDETQQFPNYLPSENGPISLRVTTRGRLVELDEVFNFRNGVRRPLPICEILAGYQKGRSCAALPRRHEFICLAIEGPRYALSESQILTRAIRAALMAILGDDAPATLHGHGDSPHVTWIPLSDVGHQYASGMILGIGLGIPIETQQTERLALLRGLASLPFVVLPDGRNIKLRVLPTDNSQPQALQPRTWIAASHGWATVTPVVLDRPPRHGDPDKVKAALAQSLVLAGYPEPEEVEVSTHSVFGAAPYALAFPASTPRYHAIIRFPELVEGPVIAGRQRNFGVGLFRPYNRHGEA